MLNHATTELFFDDLEVPVANLLGEEGKGFRYILDGMNAERILIASECIGDGRFFIDRAVGLRPATARCSAAPSARTRACSSRSPAPMSRSAAAALMVDHASVHVRRRRPLRRGGQHGQTAGL